MGFVELVTAQLMEMDPAPFVVAIIVGSVVGLEREIHGRPAGLRTHILVCLSSTILIHASRLASVVAEPSNPFQHFVYDPNRLAAGIVTGIGFLGAAAVIRSGDMVRGITTGACVWAVASLGVVIGQGHYATALISALCIVFVLVVFDSLFFWVSPIVYRKLTISGQNAHFSAARDTAAAILRDAGITVQDLSCRLRPEADTFDLVFHIRCRSRTEVTDVVARVVALEGVACAEWGQIKP